MSNAVPLLLLFLPILVLVIAANVVEERSTELGRRRFAWSLALINLPLLLVGFLLLLFPARFSRFFDSPELIFNDPRLLGVVLLATGLWTVAACWVPFRRFLAGFLPLDSQSTVHMTALVLAGYLVGNTAVTLSQNYLEQLSELDLVVSTAEIVLQQAAFVTLAFIGSGLFTRRSLNQVNQRLGLLLPTGQQLLVAVGAIILLLLIQATIGGMWAFFDPQQAQELGSINESLLTDFDTVGEWLVLALAAGIGEEILFRGALQPVFGLPLTALLFAVVHVQYGLTPITVAVFLLAVVLGLVRRHTNTTVAILVHFGYNFALGLLSMLAVYLEQFVTP